MHRRTFASLLSFALIAIVPSASAQAPARQSPADLIAAEREAMAALSFMDGVWRGPAWTLLPSGEKHEITQTERIGPFLDGSVKVLEGRGYEPSGKVTFNALGIISYDVAAKTWSLHSYAMGREGSFSLTPITKGYIWEIPAGPMTIRYTMTLIGDTWLEVGDRLIPDKAPIRFFEMRLKRVGDTSWPTNDPVPQQ